MSPDEALEMARPMLLQAVVDERQLLLSLPLTPFMYQVVLARAAGAKAGSKTPSSAANTNLRSMDFSFVRPASLRIPFGHCCFVSPPSSLRALRCDLNPWRTLSGRINLTRSCDGDCIATIPLGLGFAKN